MNADIEEIFKMDFIQKSGVKIPNAVIVSGITKSEKDEEVIDFLKRYGTIQTLVPVDDVTSEFYQNLIVEYSNGSTVEALEPILPYKYTVEGDPSVVYSVRTLSSAYTTKIGGGFTKSYLSDLKGLAKLSGKEYEEVLKEMMLQISDTLETINPEDEEPPHIFYNTADETPLVKRTEGQFQSPPESPQICNDLHVTSQIPLVDARKSPSISVSDVNPPEIQRVVVEHIVRKEEIGSYLQSPVRIRPFSGKSPRSNSETDYDTWRSHVELLLKDPTMSPLQISRRILESLVSPAADVVKGLSPETLPAVYLQMLDSAFGAVEDGEELFAQFMNTLQDPGEKPSIYLHRLQLALNLAVKRGGVLSEDVNKHLLKQFCRGCWDSALLSSLQLEQQKNSPPSFAELLLMLRTAEDRQSAKADRMKKHLSSTRQRAHLNIQSICTCVEQEGISETNRAIEDIKGQIASLQSQLASVVSQKKTKTYKETSARSNERLTSTSMNANMTNQPKRTPNGRPKPWYCFNCGEDGHMAPLCTSAANPSLVLEKRKKWEEKRLEWERQSHPNNPSLDLN